MRIIKSTRWIVLLLFSGLFSACTSGVEKQTADQRKTSGPLPSWNDGKNKTDYTDCVSELDYNIGRILDKVEKMGIAENTLILYTVDNGAIHGSDGPAPLLGWTGPEKYVNIVPQVYDMWSDPQERYDIFMNSFSENTWTMAVMGKYMGAIIDSYKKYPPRPLQSEGYTGPMTITRFRNLEKVKKLMEQKNIELPNL